MKTFLKLLFILLVSDSCSDDCGNTLAETGPVGYQFEVVKKDTHENVFTLGLYSENDIQINDKNGEPVEFDFIGENEVNYISVLLGWETKSDIYTVKIGDTIEFKISFSLKRIESKCSSTTQLKTLEIQGLDAENQHSGPTRILVP